MSVSWVLGLKGCQTTQLRIYYYKKHLRMTKFIRSKVKTEGKLNVGYSFPETVKMDHEFGWISQGLKKERGVHFMLTCNELVGRLSVCLSVCLPTYLSIYISIHPSGMRCCSLKNVKFFWSWFWKIFVRRRAPEIWSPGASADVFTAWGFIEHSEISILGI